jgi:hypothetical protein
MYAYGSCIESDSWSGRFARPRLNSRRDSNHKFHLCTNSQERNSDDIWLSQLRRNYYWTIL